ncbi:putative 2-haloalkanoic acid dehalogenase [Sporormia fimetaria CBS 119925]|uniref:2-haloalkanoic acid dehalogenase n=1 Tax=Sporormia fimetaria CBS 119925 TaxID=1340428 RepID=A0A6A6VPB1_9PLEO|nr:putative 2-haloalkanoic acid dehalogenase [Sporormia fimetaria CBS 119925]
MSKLTSFRLLSFDVYGTLIDWETGFITALHPILTRNNKSDISRQTILSTCVELESAQQKKTPDMLYSDLLTTIHPELCLRLGCATPTSEESAAFGKSIKNWPAFPDTLGALYKLRKYFKLVVLSNVDNESFQSSLKGPLKDFPFDAVITAQDIGSYKPDLRNFEYMLRIVGSTFGVSKEEVLQTAQSQYHDHKPCRSLGIKGAWIDREGAVCGNVGVGEEVWDWRFGTLGEMAGEVEREAGEKEG